MKFKKMDDQALLKEELDQEMMDRKRVRRECYRKFANLEEGACVDMNNLDEWALNAASCESRCTMDELKEALNEDIMNEASADNLTGTLKQAADALGAEEAVAQNQTKGQIEAALDRCLKVAKRMAGKKGMSYPNVLFISDAGFGKTASCRAWAAENGINLVEVRASTLDPTDIGGLFAPPEKDSTRARKISTGEFDQLEKPNSVLFLDEFNRANKAVRGALLELVNSHYIPDSAADGGMRFLPNFLFTIATINPPSGEYNVDPLDQAEVSRFRNIPLAADPKYFLGYITKLYDKEFAETDDPEEKKEIAGRKKIAQTLLTSKKFSFDDTEDIQVGHDKLDYNYHPLNYRSLTSLLNMCDGTKDDFLDLWSSMVNPLKKSTVEGILANYVDVDDKANDALKTETDSQVFKKKLNPLDALKNKYPDLNI